ncbi:MAG: hypothetical protein ABW215_01055 [Kibdelosporangium sp.]
MTERNPRSHGRHLVEMMQRGDDESMVLEMARLTADRADGGRDAHAVASELVAALAQMMISAAGPEACKETTYGLELTGDDENQVDIDHTSPPVRAAVRALLAELNEHPQDAGYQLDLALRETTFKATIEVMAHIVLWTIGMLEWCDDNGVPRPRWLGAMASARRAGGQD